MSYETALARNRPGRVRTPTGSTASAGQRCGLRSICVRVYIYIYLFIYSFVHTYIYKQRDGSACGGLNATRFFRSAIARRGKRSVLGSRICASCSPRRAQSHHSFCVDLFCLQHKITCFFFATCQSFIGCGCFQKLQHLHLGAHPWVKVSENETTC